MSYSCSPIDMYELTAVRNAKYIHQLQLIIVTSTYQYQHKSRYK